MKLFTKICAIVSIACAATGTLAQQAEDQPQSYTYATYYVCDVTRQGRADEIVEADMAPVYDAAVEDGTISAWGWLVHRTGGMWRRAQFYTASSIDALFAAEEAISAELQENDSGSDEEFGRICNTHEDYIWMGLASSAGNQPGSPRGEVGLSAYYVCEYSKQARADEIVRTVLAPIYDAHVGEGMFSSWGWQGHFVGGEYRRLGTVTADDFPTLLETRNLIIAATADNELAAEFNEICGSHADYLWDIRLETP